MVEQEPMAEYPASDAGSEPIDDRSRRRMMIGVIATVILLIVIFGVVLPQIIDYDLVADAFRSMEASQHAVLFLLMVVTWAVLGYQFAMSLPGLGTVRATLWMIGSLAIKGTIPGPMDAAFRFRIASAYHHPIEASAISAASLKGYDWIARMLMPLFAVVILVGAGQQFSGLGWLVVIALVLSVGGMTLLIAVIRSEPLARRFGDWAERMAASIARRLDRDPPAGLTDQVLSLRETGQSLLSVEGLVGLGLTVLVQAVNAVMLTLAMDFVGVDFKVLPVSVIWAAVAFVYLLPLGPGLIELAYIAIFAVYLGDNDAMLAAAGAATMVFRVYQWLIPVPIGYALVGWWQKRDEFSLLSSDTARLA